MWGHTTLQGQIIKEWWILVTVHEVPKLLKFFKNQGIGIKIDLIKVVYWRNCCPDKRCSPLASSWEKVADGWQMSQDQCTDMDTKC